MRYSLFALIVATATLFVALALAGPAAAHGPCEETFDRPGASDYGRDHLASHAPHGLGIEDAHNPGTHRGYSLCLGVHD
jgi:hypothetical protein